MIDRPLTRRTVLQGFALYASGAAAAALAQEQQPAGAEAATTTTLSAEDKAARIRQLEEYFAKLYAKPLASPERLPREIAVVSLSRIDAPATTAALLGVLKPPVKEPVVAYLAWEALHARHGSLSPAERREWAAGGLRAGAAGGFPGWTAAPLLRVLPEQPPAGFDVPPAKFATRVVQENDLADADGKATLDALRDLIAAWHDPSVVKALLGSFNKPGLAARVDHVLRGLPSPPPPNEKDPGRLVGPWNAWLKSAVPKPADASELKPYAGKATIFAAPERITSPADLRWRKDLEIGKCTVTDFDVVWCIDSTGSMSEVNQRVASETGTLARVCGLVSRRARCGAVYYRHETEASLAQRCCGNPMGAPPFYKTKAHKLTADAAALVAAMAAERIPQPDPRAEGNVHPGCAYHGALKAAIAEQPWSKDKQSRRVVVLVGDSPLTAGSEKACADLTAEASKNGYDVHALVAPRAVSAWADAVKAGGGQLITFAPGSGRVMKAGPATRPAGAAGTVDVVGDTFREVLAAVLRPAVASDYHDRVDPLLAALVPFAQASAAAERAIPSR